MTATDKIIFSFRDEELGLDVDAVDSVVEVDRFTLIPHTPPFLKGVITLRSEMITVVDIPRLFQQEGSGQDSPRRIVVARVDNTSLGLYIGNAAISFLWKENIDDGQWSEKRGEYSTGIFSLGEREIRMIDMNSLLRLVERTISRGGLQVMPQRTARVTPNA